MLEDSEKCDGTLNKASK